MKKTSFIAWVRYDRRPDLLAERFGTRPHYIVVGRQGRLWQAPLRYPIQAWKTWRLLRRERPDVVYVQNPPIFAVMVAYLYARLHGAQYVIDSHTSAFIAPRWRWALGLLRVFARRALAMIVHNKSQAEMVKDWGVRYVVIGFLAGDYPPGSPYPLQAGEADGSGQYHVAVISTYELDEPLDVVFEAARQMPDVSFYVTGDSRRITPELLAQKPPNCHLTGFVPYDQYIGLLRQAGSIIDLTTRNHTLLMGGFEAVSLGTPLITSDWPILREYFSRGTVHVPNSVEGVCHGVRYAQEHEETLRQEMVALKATLEAEWQCNAAELWELIQDEN
ncbi:MAG TPA: glycosyltransferase [Anaerolineae bacterium]|nr:glycosyltransferase [Anaerolineae bacterium]